MFKMLKFLFISFSFSILCFNAYGFDLKSLTDKIQKDLGDKLQVPKGNNSNNPLGGMLKNLNQNNKNLNSSAIGTNVSSINTSNNQVNAKRVCGRTIPKTLKNLPKGNVNDLESDFGKKSNEIVKILNSIPKVSDDPYVSSLKTFEGAFETEEIEKLFGVFLKKKDINSLATIRAISKIDPGFNKNKKQIKADALFAYGLIHYYFRNEGGNKNLGIRNIKEATSSPDNIGALTVYGAWQFYGLNVKQNIEAGNMAALTGYQRADEKKRKRNVSGPFKGLKPFQYSEKIFFSIAADNRNPYKSQYQSQLAQAQEMNKKVLEELAKSEKNDPKSGYWPFVVEIQNRQHNILDALAENLGLGQQLSELKAQYAVLASKVSTDNSLVERMVIINEEMNKRVQKALNTTKEVDEKGKQQIADLSYDNEIIILKNESLVASLMTNLIAQGGFGSGFYELTRISVVAGKSNSIACEVYTGVNSYASRTKINMPKPVTSENTKFKSKFRKKRS